MNAEVEKEINTQNIKLHNALPVSDRVELHGRSHEAGRHNVCVLEKEHVWHEEQRGADGDVSGLCGGRHGALSKHTNRKRLEQTVSFM